MVYKELRVIQWFLALLVQIELAEHLLVDVYIVPVVFWRGFVFCFRRKRSNIEQTADGMGTTSSHRLNSIIHTSEFSFVWVFQNGKKSNKNTERNKCCGTFDVIPSYKAFKYSNELLNHLRKYPHTHTQRQHCHIGLWRDVQLLHLCVHVWITIWTMSI